MSHIIAAHLTVGVIRWKINLFLMLENFPHNIKNMRFAECIYYPKREIMSREKGIISLAPRIPDIVFAFLTPITALVNEPYCYILTILFGGSLIDLFVGSEGISDRSDLKRAADSLNINPWVLRIIGMSIFIICVITTSVNYLVKTGVLK